MIHIPVTPSGRHRSPRTRLYPTRRDYLRGLWAERLRAAAETEEGETTNLPTPAEWLPKGRKP